ncbi:MAG: histidine--tRNA ligase [bacterium]|nr:histidine--tRNA ligase [bacterium]
MAKKEDTPKKSVKKEVKLSLLQSPRGMHDILPSAMPLWTKIKEEARDIAEFYGFLRIETPLLEAAELYERGIGEETDVIEKEMYTLRTKGSGKLALRPEYTAAIMRSYLQHGMHRLPQPQRLYSFGPVFRHDRPQAGRYRQFHHFNLEILGGDSDAIYDAQVMIVFYKLIEELKVKPLIIQINSIGCRICRPNYRKKLIEHYRDEEICKDCERRLKVNPIRLLDCKKEVCQPAKAGVPNIFDSLCSPCRSHLKQVLEYLEEANLPYVLNHLLARGLDYYSRTVFEIFLEEGGLALVGGGRYDYLAEVLGGRPTPAVGGALGIQRLIEILQTSGTTVPLKTSKPKVFLVHIGNGAKKKSLSLMEELRRANISTSNALGKDSLSAQLEAANKIGAPLALILGQKEVYEGSIIIRDMENGVQESIPMKNVVEEIKKRLRS